MRRLALLALLAVLGAALLGSTSRAETAATKPRLAPFGSCGQLLAYAKSNATKLVGPYGLGGLDQRGGIAETARTAAPAQQGVDFSGTNVQEEGVDEPDIVKTDGNTLYAVANGKLNALDVSDPKPRLLDSLALNPAMQHELLLHRDRILVLSRGGFWIEPLPATSRSIAPYHPAQSTLSEVNVSDPKRLRLVRTLTLDGSYVAARLVGGSVRIVVGAQVPGPLPFTQPQTQEDVAAATRRNRAIVASSRLKSWLPTYRIRRAGAKPGKARPLVQCRHVRRAASFSGLGMLTVLTVDLAKGLEPTDSVAVMTDGRIVYASPESLYVATERWADRPAPDKPQQEQNGVTTAIHKFDISSPQRTQYRGSGTVTGFLLSQWSLSEHKGVLRVVSTETPAWWGDGRGESQSFLTTLRPSGGSLVQAGRVGGLGKGERVYSVRMIGDTGYVVTFRQIDPLYTIDLADPERPRVLGELKIPGYSAYLHPLGDDLILGVGQDATEQGRPTGTQVSVFDVSNLRKPTRLHTERLGEGWSEAEGDHRAFLYWPRTALMVVPFNQEAVGLRVSRRGIDRVGRVEHDKATQIRRSVVIRDGLLTVSDRGVLASSLATLAERGFVAFPPPK